MRDQHVFENYANARFAETGATLPHEKLAIIRQLRNELHGRGAEPGIGEIPLDVDADGDGVPDVFTFNVQHETYGRLLRGEKISVGSTPVKQKRSQSQQIALFAIGSVALISLVTAVLFLTKPKPVAAVIEPTATLEPTAEPTIAPTAIPTPLPTAEPVADVQGEVSLSPADPVSIELGGEVFLTSVGSVGGDGAWKPRTDSAEWLEGTAIRRVFAVPYSDRLSDTLFNEDVAPIAVRLRNGDTVVYEQVKAQIVRRDQIEWLQGRSPSVVVVLYTDEGDQRIVVTGVWNPEESSDQN